MLDLYKNIRERRKALKMSQEELAKLVGYTNRSTIATIEAGRMDIPISKIKDIAHALGCSSAALMGWDSDSKDAFEMGMHDADLLVKYHKLNEKYQKAIDTQIDLFLEMQEQP